MKLALGQRVDTLDGPFGELGDIVVDPQRRVVTHVVVEPYERHRQARLVPVWMVTGDDDTLTIQLDAPHARQLQQASFSDYVYLADPIELGDEWDVGTVDSLRSPFPEIDAGVWGGDGYSTVRYDRIPRGEIEIRHRSRVRSRDHWSVGHVVGLVTEGDDVVGIAVRQRLPRRRVVLVPIDRVARVRTDQVDLGITRHEFAALPTTDDFDHDAPSIVRRSLAAASPIRPDTWRRLIDRVRSTARPSG